VDLSFIDQVRTYYFNHFSELDAGHQFHFASRLASWSPDPDALSLLKGLREDFITPPSFPTHQAHLASLIEAKQTGRRVAHDLRHPYFERYPDLFGVEKALFRVRHLKYVYGVDMSKDFYEVYSKEKLQDLKSRLAKDPDALRILSTFAVNTFFVSTAAVGDPSPLTPDDWYEIGLHYNESIPEHIQLLIYLYTHTIIGAANFYAQHVPQDDIPVYEKMLKKLESVIDTHFNDISLDNKLEFLVAARIIAFHSGLDERIYKEAAASMSREGDFLIERHNTNLRPDRQTFPKAEHRSVLLLLSNRNYDPQPLPVLLNS
jgi:hypothetical protein